MAILTRMVVGLGFVILLLLVASFFIPSERTAERSVVIDATPARVFDQVNKPENWENWMPRDTILTELASTRAGKREGVGAAQRMGVPGRGGVTYTIKRSVPDRLVEIEMAMDRVNLESIREIVIEEGDGTGVKVTCRETWRLGRNPMYKYFGLGFERVVVPDLERAAENLKAYCEGGG